MIPKFASEGAARFANFGIGTLASTARPASSLALIEIGEALSTGLRTLARVFGRALRIAGPITFVPFTCVGSSDRRERHS